MRRMKHTVFKRRRSDENREMSINGKESNEKLVPVKELTASVFETTSFVIRVSGSAAVSREAWAILNAVSLTTEDHTTTERLF